MANTLLEETRQCHEDMERLERLIVRDFKNEPQNYKEKLVQGHRVKVMLETLGERAGRLVRVAQLVSQYVKNELNSMQNRQVCGNVSARL